MNRMPTLFSELLTMSSEQERLLQLRQMELRLRSAELRVKLSRDALALRRPLGAADRFYQGYLWLRERPQWLLGGSGGLVAVLAVLRPRRLLRWVGKGFWAWQLFKRWTGSRKQI